MLGRSVIQETFDSHVEEALDDVKGGQHLRFINDLYKTKEVCYAAVSYESEHGGMYDIGSVPMGNISYVMEKMRSKEHLSKYYMALLEKEFERRKEREKNPDYYGDGKTLQDILDFWQVSTYDDLLRARYDVFVDGNKERWLALKQTADLKGIRTPV